MADSFDIAAADYQPGRHDFIIDSPPDGVAGLQFEIDQAEWPARYLGDPLGPLGTYEISLSWDGVEYEHRYSSGMWKTQFPRRGVTLVSIKDSFPSGEGLTPPSFVRASLILDTEIRTPVRLRWLTAEEARG